MTPDITPHDQAPHRPAQMNPSNRVTKLFGLARVISIHDLDDHLAFLLNYGYSMEVHRFFYEDMVSMMAGRNRVPVWTLAGWGLMVTAGSVLGISTLVVAGSVGLLVQAWMGFRVTLEIRTVHSVRRYHYLSSLRRIRKVIAAVASRITEAQGGWPVGPPRPEPQSALMYAGDEPRTNVPLYTGPQPNLAWLYLLLWAMILPNFGVVVFGMVFPKIMAIIPFLFSVTLVGMIAIQVRLNRFKFLPANIRALSWYGGLSAILSILVCLIFYYRSMFALSINHSDPWISSYRILIDMSLDADYQTFMYALSINLLLASLAAGWALSRALAATATPQTS